MAFGVVEKAASQEVCRQPQPRWDNGIGHSSWDLALEPEDCKKMLSLWESIGEDLKTDQSALVGTYFKGGDSGFFLRWSTAGGFVIVPYFDQNLIGDYSYGKVTLADESDVIFTPTKELHGGRGLARTPRKWTAILGRFIPVATLADFARFRAGLGVYNEFNGGCCEFVPDFLTGRIDRSDKILPQGVPVRYQHFTREAITGTITFVGKPRRVRDWGYQGKLYEQWLEKAVLIPIGIDVGSRRGVKKNMLFRMVSEPQFERYLQVTRVGSLRSRGFVVQDISSGSKPGFYRTYEANQDKPLPVIRAGMKITTSPIIE
jgi:hypothetical protein